MILLNQFTSVSTWKIHITDWIFHKELNFFDIGLSLIISFFEPHSLKFDFYKDHSTGSINCRISDNDDKPLKSNSNIQIASDEIVEVKIPFTAVTAKKDESVRFIIALEKDGGLVERWPSSGYVSFEVPTEDFDLLNWYV